ncbi:MAG TPA: hypothetical protein VMX57_05545 [Planctomycetota bacterium]|nr:hypothetical protein [Planctomycetota bacterium]
MRKTLILTLLTLVCGCGVIPKRPDVALARAVVSIPARAAGAVVDKSIDTAASLAVGAAKTALVGKILH